MVVMLGRIAAQDAILESDDLYYVQINRMTSVYTVEFLTGRVDTMLKYRGYKRTLIAGKFIFGADHPVRKDVVVGYIDDDGEYSKARMQSNIEEIRSTITKLKAHAKKETKSDTNAQHKANSTGDVNVQHSATTTGAVNSQHDVISGGAKAKAVDIDFPIDTTADIITVYVHGYFNKKINEIDTGYRVELFKWYDLLADHSLPRFTRNWRIVESSYAEMVRGYPMQNKLSLLANDIMARYIGACVGDTVYYESFERTDGVMIYVPIIRYVTEEADIVEELADAPDTK